MNRKKWMLTGAVLLAAILALYFWHTRWQPLTQQFVMDTSAENGFIKASTWYPFVDDSKYAIDTCEAGTALFEELTAILDGITCRKTLFSNRSPNTILKEPSVPMTYCCGERRIWMTFNGRFLKMGEFGDRVGRLYKVKPESGRQLSEWITQNGYKYDTYLQEMK